MQGGTGDPAGKRNRVRANQMISVKLSVQQIVANVLRGKDQYEYTHKKYPYKGYQIASEKLHYIFMQNDVSQTSFCMNI